MIMNIGGIVVYLNFVCVFYKRVNRMCFYLVFEWIDEMK